MYLHKKKSQFCRSVLSCAQMTTLTMKNEPFKVQYWNERGLFFTNSFQSLSSNNSILLFLAGPFVFLQHRDSQKFNEQHFFSCHINAVMRNTSSIEFLPVMQLLKTHTRFARERTGLQHLTHIVSLKPRMGLSRRKWMIWVVVKFRNLMLLLRYTPNKTF